MDKSKIIICILFFLSFAILALTSCYGIDLLIENIGEDKLDTYYSIGALICAAGVLAMTYLSNRVSPFTQLFGMHAISLCVSLGCLFLKNQALKAQTMFLSSVGLDMLIYFVNWGVAGRFVSTFESRRVFPYIVMSGSAGLFCGNLLAIASSFGLSKGLFIPMWAAIETAVIVLGVMLFLIDKKKTKENAPSESEEAADEKGDVGIIRLFSSYKLVPNILFWVLIWSLVFNCVNTLAGMTFAGSDANLTALYGCLELSTSFISALIPIAVYPFLLRAFRLSGIFLAAGIILAATTGPYLLFSFFWVAVLAYVVVDLIDGGLISVTLSTEFTLYPTSQRSKIRLLSEVLAASIGGACVGLVFMLPQPLIPWVIAGLIGVLIALALVARKNFDSELNRFLESSIEEEKRNAIAVFDNPNDSKNYQRLVKILTSDPSIETRMDVVHTFANLKLIKPIASILNMLETTQEIPFKMAILRYLDEIDFESLDPFAKMKALNILKDISRSKTSNVLRSMAIKTFVHNGPPEMTVNFVLEALKDSDERTIANAIEGLTDFNYGTITEIVQPFLKHPVARVKANAVIALWKYVEVRDQVNAALDEMLASEDAGVLMSGIYALGEVKDVSKLPYLEKRMSDPRKEIQRNVAIALLKLGKAEHFTKVVEMILGDDEKQAINVCWLTLRLNQEILDEKIIAHIYGLGTEKRELAKTRFARCGGFCRDQIKLLSGERSTEIPD